MSGKYYTTKGMGSQESYDAYYDKTGDSLTWSKVNIGTQSNIATVHKGGKRKFVTTHDMITEETKSKLWILVSAAFLYMVI